MLRPTHNIKGLHLFRQRLSTPGPSLAPAQRAIVEQASASFARRFSGGTLKKPQRQPHHRGTGAIRDLPGKHIPAMGENTDTLAQVDAPFPLTEVDKWVLSQTDEEFKCHDWDELCVILRTACPYCSSIWCPETTHLTHAQRTTISIFSRESHPIFGGTSSGLPRQKPSMAT